MKKLLIIDSNSIINRAFYGVRYLSAKDGTPTNAIYGFLNTLFKLIEEVKPDYLCTAYDLKAPTFRHKLYDGYKAQRKPMPEDLKKQMPISKEILSAMGIKHYELEGYEADDIIGTVSKICDENGTACYIATGDKDDLQLATDKTQVILTVTRNGVNETTYYDENAVKERYHVTPKEFIDIKALMGDPSDNIPGVAGVGEKTAMSLIEKYKSIEYIYDHIDEIGLKGAMLKKVTDGKESAFMSKTLATIDRNVPMEFNIEDCVFGGSISDCATDKVHSILARLNLNSIIKRLDFTPRQTKETETEDIFEGTVIREITKPEQLSEFIDGVGDELSFSFNFDGDKLSSAGLASGKNAVGIDLYAVDRDKVMSELSRLFSKEGIKLFGCGVKEDMVKLHGSLSFDNLKYDVEIAEYLINPAKSDYSVTSLVFGYFGIELAKEKSKQVSMFEDSSDYELSAKKALAIKPLMLKTRELLKKNGQEKLYRDIELPLVSVLADMQIYGIRIDKEQLGEFSKMLDGRINELVNEIYSLAGEEFNINSPKQLGVILFEKLGLTAVKKTKTGYSTNADVLEKLKGKHPIIEAIMEYRQLAKLKSTYCDGLSAVINPKTGRIHSQFKQTVTVTGRISSTEPNMQNIPVRTPLGRELRKMFIAENENYTLIDADYSQIELRVLAHIADDKTMIKAFCDNEDIHAVTASQVLGIPLSEVTSEQRSSAKAVNFGIVYGIGEYSLAQDLKIPVKAAREYINGYLEKYSGVRDYMSRIKQEAERDGYVKTMMNRIRYIPELKSTNHNIHAFGERVALNTPIQGTAADIIKAAMVNVHRRLKKEKMKSRLILQVHDELIIEAPKDEVQKASEILKSEMENVIKLRAPLKADVGTGYSWHSAKG